MKKLLVSLTAFCVVAIVSSHAMALPTDEVERKAAGAPESGWRTSCAAADRSVALNCSVEQRVVIGETGRSLVNVMVRVDGAERIPALMVQVPLGLYLPAGVTILIDKAKPEKLDLQTCDGAGCYAGMALSDKFLALMIAGRQLSITFQDLAKQKVNVTMPLLGFSAGFQKIK